MPLEVLYQTLILDHYKNPRNYGKLDGAAVRMRHENPSCGDQIELYIELTAAGKIAEIKFESWGCALSRASASMMTMAVRHQTAIQAHVLDAAFRDLAREQRELGRSECVRRRERVSGANRVRALAVERTR